MSVKNTSSERTSATSLRRNSQKTCMVIQRRPTSSLACSHSLRSVVRPLSGNLSRRPCHTTYSQTTQAKNCVSPCRTRPWKSWSSARSTGISRSAITALSSRNHSTMSAKALRMSSCSRLTLLCPMGQQSHSVMLLRITLTLCYWTTTSLTRSLAMATCSKCP